MTTWREEESKALATVVIMAKRITDATERLTDVAHGVERAEETREKLYKAVEETRRAIEYLYALHKVGEPRDRHHA